MNRDHHLVVQTNASAWRFPPAHGFRTFAVLAALAAALWWSGTRLEMDRAARLSGEGVLAAFGWTQDSQVARAVATIADQMFPIVIAERTDVTQIEGFDPNRLPLFASVEYEEFDASELNPETLQMETRTERRSVLVEPYGYVLKVGVKLLETLEVALWGTLLAVFVGLPMALLNARNLTPHPVVRLFMRGVTAMLRAIPELISALLLVLAYGFGPIAGVFALGLHGAGFIGKTYADDIEGADHAPQEALAAIGAGKLKIFRHAILPQVLPAYVASTLYLLDRNARMATVIGLVGAGGIGQELKGRFDMYAYGHVGTILLGIFLLVFTLELASGALRKRLLV